MKALIILIAALAVLPSILSAGVSQSVLNQLAKEWNGYTQKAGIPASSSKVYLFNADSGKTLVVSYSGVMIDHAIREGVRTIDQLRDNTFAGITREEIRYYKSAGYTRAKVVACGKVSYYYFR